MARRARANGGLAVSPVDGTGGGNFFPPIGQPTFMSSLPEQIANALIEDIIKGSLAPGLRLQKIAIAERFGVSRGPVREALRIAEREGLVEIRPRYGAFVVRLSAKNVYDIFEVRALLMALAARRIADAHTEEMLAFLRDGSADLKATVEDADRFFAVIYRCSMYIIAKLDNELGRDILVSLARQTLHITRIALLKIEDRRLWIKNWTAVVRAIGLHQPAEAEAAMRSLVEAVSRSVQRVMAETAPAPEVGAAANG